MTDIVDELRARALQGRFNLEAADEIEQMRAELSEQCRLLGMSGERELALRAELQAAHKMALRGVEWREEERKLRAELSETRAHYEQYVVAMGQNLEDRDVEIERLRVELGQHKAARVAYASEFDGDVGSIHENIRKLKKERAEILKIAAECGDDLDHTLDSDKAFLVAFAVAVAAAEREACAELVERNADVCGPNTMLCDVLRGNAAAIRARGDA